MLIGDNGYNYADALQQFFVATGRYPDPSEYPVIEHAWDTMSWGSYLAWAQDTFGAAPAASTATTTPPDTWTPDTPTLDQTAAVDTLASGNMVVAPPSDTRIVTDGGTSDNTMSLAPVGTSPTFMPAPEINWFPSVTPSILPVPIDAEAGPAPKAGGGALLAVVAALLVFA